MHLVGLLIAAMLATSAHAASFSPQTFVDATNEAVSDIAALTGLGTDLHAYESAKPYGSTAGIDFGVTGSLVMIPGSATNALTVLGIDDVPHYLPVPKINIQKGFAGKLIVGTEFIPNVKIKGNRISMYGFDAQWTAIDRYGLPPIAIRAQFNYSDLVVASAATYGGDILASWKILFLDTYGGAGYRFVNATVNNPTSTVPSTPGVNLDATLDAGHFFAGVSMVGGFARLTLEADLTTRGVNTYGTKLSFFF